MKRLVKTISILLMIGLLLFLGIQLFDWYTTSSAPWQVELCASLNATKSEAFLITLPDEDLKLRALSPESRTAIPALLEMFVRGRHSIELFWWKHKNRATRCFVMALFFCAEDHEAGLGPWGPDFKYNSKRFDEQESLERSEELSFIFEYRSALAREIAQVLQKRDIEKYNTTYKNYFGRMGLIWFLRPLPRCCTQAKIENTADKE